MQASGLMPRMTLEELLGADADSLLHHRCETFPAADLHLPGPDFVDRVWTQSDRSARVLRSLQTLFDTGRLAGTGYLSILPVDQGVEHSAGASFAPNPRYFDSENIVRLAIDAGCNAVVSTFGVLGSVARQYAHRIPFIVKINHNELLTYPNRFDQVLFGTVEQASNLGAVAVGATIYFGSLESRRELEQIAVAFHEAHELGMATVLWCYLRNSAFKREDRLPRCCRPHRPGQPPGRHHRGRHHQAEAANHQRRLPGPGLRQDVTRGLQQADQRPPHRPLPLPGDQLLRRAHWADQLRRGLAPHRP